MFPFLILIVLSTKQLQAEVNPNCSKDSLVENKGLCITTSEIIDKINSFFGYNCISKVTLRIVQEKIKPIKNSFPKIKNFTKINEKMDKIKNGQLKSSLNNFLKAFDEKNR